LFRILPHHTIIFVCINNSVETKKGKSEGTTEFAHSDNPDFTAGRLLLEKINKQKVNPRNKIGNIFLFNLIT
jgi:hypothetical protein